ncbi:MAG: glycosyltransferase [Chloroflexi bacterium]|nr:glycosyltransferase [Chloroflexota bacterium]
MAATAVTRSAAAPGLGAVAAHGAVWLSLAAYGFVTSTVVFRSTGQADYGVWATIAAIRSALLIVDGGLAFGVTRDVALATTGDEDAVSRLRMAARVYAVVGIVVALLGVAFAWVPGALLGIGPSRPEIALITILIAVETALALAFAPANASLRGMGRFDLLAVASLAMAVVGSLLLVWWTPAWGLVGAAAAVVGGRVVGGGVSLALLFPRFLVVRSSSAAAGQLSRVIRFAGPMWAIAIASAVGMATDVPIVGALFGAGVAGAYGIGAVIPMAVAALMFVLLDTAFPRLTTLARASVGHVVRILATVGTLVAAIALGSVAASASDLLTIWVGGASDLASRVTGIYALVWLINVPVHVLVLAAIARGQHGLLVPVVLGEAVVNIGLSLALAVMVGPVGPALATLATLAVSNLLLVPALLARTAGVSLVRFLPPILVAGIIGLSVGGLVRLSVTPLANDVLRVGVHAALASAAIAIVGAAAFRKRTLAQRWLGVIFDGGWRVLRREASERRAMATTLSWPRPKARSTQSASPLVTVRIATYNRGPIVAERAIASALAQTYRNIEVVVVGDHCDEATERAVRSVHDSRIRFENLPQRGTYPDDPMFRWMVAGAAPMNHALTLARGEWIAPLDDDDEFTTDHVELLLEACLTRGLDVAYGKADMEVRPGEWMPVGSWPPAPGEIVHASVLYSLRLRAMPHNVDSWRLNEPGDWNLWRRMLGAGARFGFVDRVVVRHYLEYREVVSGVPR